MLNPAAIPLALVMGIFAVLTGFADCAAATSRKAPEMLAVKVRIVGNGGEAVIALYDNPVSKDFISLLPLSAAFRDYAGEEKIAVLPRRLNTVGRLAARNVQGDFAYYVPWGNLAVFYRGFGKDSGLCILGRIESGKEWLEGQQNDFAARIEIVGRHARTRQQERTP